jgi:hypothetical protein
MYMLKNASVAHLKTTVDPIVQNALNISVVSAAFQKELHPDTVHKTINSRFYRKLVQWFAMYAPNPLG